MSSGLHLHIRVNETDRARIEAIAANLGKETTTEVIKDSLRLMLYVSERMSEGATFHMVEKGSSEPVQIILV